MAYPQKLLSDGETVTFEMRPHWRALVFPGLILIAEVFGAAFLLTLVNRSFDTDAASSVSTWAIWLVALFVFLVFVVRPFLYWITTQYVFTNRRIIVRSGLIARHGRDMPLSKVNNVSFDVSVPGRILNYGTLTIDSASDEALIINDVPNVEQIQREVNRLHEEDDERRRRQRFEDEELSAPPAPQPAPQPAVDPSPAQPYADPGTAATQQFPPQYPSQPAPTRYPPQQFPPPQGAPQHPAPGVGPAAEPSTEQWPPQAPDR